MWGYLCVEDETGHTYGKVGGLFPVPAESSHFSVYLNNLLASLGQFCVSRHPNVCVLFTQFTAECGCLLLGGTDRDFWNTTFRCPFKRNNMKYQQ